LASADAEFKKTQVFPNLDLPEIQCGITSKEIKEKTKVPTRHVNLITIINQ
jgi:hypothetical protein